MLVNVDDERLSTGELLMQWRDATRAAELAERLAEIAAQAADQADRGALASDQIARMAQRAAVAAERAARSARKAAGARGRFQDGERATNRRQGLPR